MLLKGDMTFQGKILPKVKIWDKKKKRDAKLPHMRLLPKGKTFGGSRYKRY